MRGGVLSRSENSERMPTKWGDRWRTWARTTDNASKWERKRGSTFTRTNIIRNGVITSLMLGTFKGDK